MLRLVEASKRIQWDTFTVQNEYATRFLINVGIAIVSESMINVMTSFRQWSGIRYLNEDNEYEIGYGIGDPNKEQGYTEAEAYAEWVGWLRNRQKSLRAQLPIVTITQAAFDALLSLYVDTGSWRTVEAEEGVYDLADAVKKSNWLLVADILSRGKINPNLRRAEARAVMLGDYTATVTRQQQRIKGIQDLRRRYIAGMLDEFTKKQAEFVYYRQLGSFLPGMSQLRQRRVIVMSS